MKVVMEGSRLAGLVTNYINIVRGLAFSRTDSSITHTDTTDIGDEYLSFWIC